MKKSRVIRADIEFVKLINQKIEREIAKGNKNFSQVDATRFFASKIKTGAFLTIHDWL